MGRIPVWGDTNSRSLRATGSPAIGRPLHAAAVLTAHESGIAEKRVLYRGATRRKVGVGVTAITLRMAMNRHANKSHRRDGIDLTLTSRVAIDCKHR